MGIEILSDGVLPNQTATFTFQKQVYAYALGIWGFRLSYGADTDHWVQDLSLRMLPVQTEVEATVGNVIQARVEARLSDSSGNTIDPSDSTIRPVCVAVTGMADARTVMTAVNGVANGQQAPVSLPGSGLFSILSSFLSGFTLDYSSTDHQVLGASAGCGITNNQSQGFVTASAHLYDASGNRANSTNVDASVIASINNKPGFATAVVTRQTGNPIEVDFSPQLSSVSSVACLLNSWEVKFPSVHNVRAIQVGSWGWPKISGTKVTLPNLWASIQDGSGNTQDDSASNATVLVIAVP